MPASSRYLTLTQANVDHSHIYLTDCMDIFPPDAVGGADKSESASRTVRVQFGSEHVDTDIVGNKHIFRRRGWVRRFFTENRMAAGHRVLLEQLEPYSYRVSKEPYMRLKCISIQQPWADLILDGSKRVENRSRTWKAAQNHLKSGAKVQLGIHASSSLSVWNELEKEERYRLAPKWSEDDSSASGAVVGLVDLIDICRPKQLTARLQTHKFTDDKYEWCWVLANPRRLLEPFQARGNAWLFNVDVPQRLLPTVPG